MKLSSLFCTAAVAMGAFGMGIQKGVHDGYEDATAPLLAEKIEEIKRRGVVADDSGWRPEFNTKQMDLSPEGHFKACFQAWYDRGIAPHPDTDDNTAAIVRALPATEPFPVHPAYINDVRGYAVQTQAAQIATMRALHESEASGLSYSNAKAWSVLSLGAAMAVFSIMFIGLEDAKKKLANKLDSEPGPQTV